MYKSRITTLKSVELSFVVGGYTVFTDVFTEPETAALKWAEFAVRNRLVRNRSINKLRATMTAYRRALPVFKTYFI